MAACPIYCLTIKNKCLCVMSVSLTDNQNDEPAYLTKTFAGLEVALCELTYYHQWHNISAALKNNQVSNRHTTTVPDGYYNVCELSEVVFQPLETELNLHAPPGRLQLSAKKRLVLNSDLAKLLWFSLDRFEPGNTYIADEPDRLAVYREICVHLAEVSSSDNLHNGHPSTLLRSVPVATCGSGRTETFPVLQYKRLAQGANPQLIIKVRDVNGRKLSLAYLSATHKK